MNKVSMMKSLVVAVVLAAGVSGIAQADDGGMGRFGDSYAYFNSSESLAGDFAKPTFDKAPSTFRIAYPNGLSERQLQALSSESFAWHSSPRAATSALASTTDAASVNTAAK